MGVDIETIFDLADEDNNEEEFTLEVLNYRMQSLIRAKADLEAAKDRFIDGKNRENYIDYDNLIIAIYCIEKEIERFKTKTWK